MRLWAGMSEEEVLGALTRASVETWGTDHLEVQRKALDQAAKAISRVMSVSLSPLSEEPDVSGPSDPCAEEV